MLLLLLLVKLHFAYFRRPFLELLRSFLAAHRQVVAISYVSCSTNSVRSRVPQCTALSPMIFNICAQDLSYRSPLCGVFEYADDTLLLSHHLNYKRALVMLQKDTFITMTWFRSNLISLNQRKTQLLCFHNLLKYVTVDAYLCLRSSEGSQLCGCWKRYKCKIPTHLFWGGILLAYASKWGLRVSCMLYNNKAFLPMSENRLIVHSLALCVIRYRITILFNCSDIWHTKVRSIIY